MSSFDCTNFSEGRCRSCSRLALPSPERITQKFALLESRLRGQFGGSAEFAPPFIPEPIDRSRTKAKMSVTGTLEAPCIGILDSELRGQELLDCPLHVPLINGALTAVHDLIPEFKLTPYDIDARRGELKGLVLKAAADGSSVIVRFVLRSTEAVPRVRKAAQKLMSAIPEVSTVTANIQPIPHAIVEGPEEIVVAGSAVQWERYGEIELAFAPQSFSQVTPKTANALYGAVTSAAARLKPDFALDLFCGVGGFSLHAARHTGRVIGVELSSVAIDCARLAAERNSIQNADFFAQPADDFLRRLSERPQLVICNPPRRGLRPEVTAELERIRPERIFYSSCNPDTLMDDIAALNSYRPVRFSPFEMFPMTEHVEVLCELESR